MSTPSTDIMQYLPAALHLLLAGFIAFACICRSRLMDKSTDWRIVRQHDALFASAILSICPPGIVYGQLILLAGISIFLLLGSRRWNHPTESFLTSLSEKPLNSTL